MTSPSCDRCCKPRDGTKGLTLARAPPASCECHGGKFPPQILGSTILAGIYFLASPPPPTMRSPSTALATRTRPGSFEPPVTLTSSMWRTASFLSSRWESHGVHPSTSRVNLPPSFLVCLPPFPLPPTRLLSLVVFSFSLPLSPFLTPPPFSILTPVRHAFPAPLLCLSSSCFLHPHKIPLPPVPPCPQVVEAPLPPAPVEIGVMTHWLLVNGIQPDIPENAPLEPRHRPSKRSREGEDGPERAVGQAAVTASALRAGGEGKGGKEVATAQGKGGSKAKEAAAEDVQARRSPPLSLHRLFLLLLA